MDWLFELKDLSSQYYLLALLFFSTSTIKYKIIQIIISRVVFLSLFKYGSLNPQDIKPYFVLSEVQFPHSTICKLLVHIHKYENFLSLSPENLTMVLLSIYHQENLIIVFKFSFQKHILLTSIFIDLFPLGFIRTEIWCLQLKFTFSWKRFHKNSGKYHPKL